MEKFSEDVFLRMVERRQPPKLLRRVDWRKLYKRFLRGPHFWPWFNMRRRMLGEQLTKICRELRLHTRPTLTLRPPTNQFSILKNHNIWALFRMGEE